MDALINWLPLIVLGIAAVAYLSHKRQAAPPPTVAPEPSVATDNPLVLATSPARSATPDAAPFVPAAPEQEPAMPLQDAPHDFDAGQLGFVEKKLQTPFGIRYQRLPDSKPDVQLSWVLASESGHYGYLSITGNGITNPPTPFLSTGFGLLHINGGAGDFKLRFESVDKHGMPAKPLNVIVKVQG